MNFEFQKSKQPFFLYVLSDRYYWISVKVAILGFGFAWYIEKELR